MILELYSKFRFDRRYFSTRFLTELSSKLKDILCVYLLYVFTTLWIQWKKKRWFWNIYFNYSTFPFDRRFEAISRRFLAEISSTERYTLCVPSVCIHYLINTMKKRWILDSNDSFFEMKIVLRFFFLNLDWKLLNILKLLIVNGPKWCKITPVSPLPLSLFVPFVVVWFFHPPWPTDVVLSLIYCP